MGERSATRKPHILLLGPEWIDSGVENTMWFERISKSLLSLVRVTNFCFGRRAEGD